MKSADVAVDEYDEHDLHVIEHTRYLLSSAFKKTKDKVLKDRITAHIAAHKAAKKALKNE